MDKREAREVLQLFRPGITDAEDPRMTEALRCAQEDMELSNWFEGHCAFYVAMRTGLKSIPVPADLKGKILREEAVRKGRIVKLWNALIPLAAAAVLLLTFGGWWYFDHNAGQNFAESRDYLAKVPQRGYAMTMMSDDLGKIHSYLMGNQFPDYVLPKPLASLTAAGCATLEWQGHKVSMVCLKDAKRRDVYLFAMDRANLRGAPTSAAPEFEQVHRLMTASWTQGDRIYVLAGPGDAEELKAYLD